MPEEIQFGDEEIEKPTMNDLFPKLSEFEMESRLLRAIQDMMIPIGRMTKSSANRIASLEANAQGFTSGFTDLDDKIKEMKKLKIDFDQEVSYQRKREAD